MKTCNLYYQKVQSLEIKILIIYAILDQDCDREVRFLSILECTIGRLAGIVNGDIVCWASEIYDKPAQQVVSSRFDNAELDGLVRAGCFVDVYFCLDAYDYQGRAGIRLVVKKLVLHPN